MLLVLPKFYDLHAHLRDGELLKAVVPHHTATSAYVLVMPNLKPPIETAEQLLAYRLRIMEAQPGPEARKFTPLLTVKLTRRLTPAMVREAKRAGAVAVKFYPEGVTTNAEDGLADIFDAHDVLREIRDQDLVLCLHGETPNHDPDTAEQKFLRDLLDLVRCFPGMRIVFEHVTSAKLVKTIERLPPNVAATITAHHLFLTKGDVYSGKTLTSPHHFCKPLAKQAKDREALCRVILEGNPKFFLGSDSAPHLRSLKEGPIECCPAGVYTAPILAPVLAEFFLRAGGMHRFEGFTSGFGRAFYRLPPPTTSLTLVQMPWEVPAEYDGIVPFMAGRTLQFQLAS